MANLLLQTLKNKLKFEEYCFLDMSHIFKKINVRRTLCAKLLMTQSRACSLSRLRKYLSKIHTHGELHRHHT